MKVKTKLNKNKKEENHTGIGTTTICNVTNKSSLYIQIHFFIGLYEFFLRYFKNILIQTSCNIQLGILLVKNLVQFSFASSSHSLLSLIHRKDEIGCERE